MIAGTRGCPPDISPKKTDLKKKDRREFDHTPTMGVWSPQGRSPQGKKYAFVK